MLSHVGNNPLSLTKRKTVRTFYDVHYRKPEVGEVAGASMADLFLPVPDPTSLSKSDGADQIRFDCDPRPAILVVHGGGWITGDKWTLGGLCNVFAQRGYVVLTSTIAWLRRINFPLWVDDVREGLIYLAEHADRLKIDVDRIGTYGYSAGGHLTSLVGVLGNEPRSEQTIASCWSADDARWNQIPKVIGMCAGGPPSDFRSMPPKNKGFTYFLGGTRESLPESLQSGLTARLRDSG